MAKTKAVKSAKKTTAKPAEKTVDKIKAYRIIQAKKTVVRLTSELKTAKEKLAKLKA
jgi:hypothetical protein